MTASGATTSGFVGRKPVMADLRACVDRTVAGAGGLILVTGEAGIGKTRLVEEVAAYAGGAGVGLRRASGWEGDGAPAFWPWIQIIRAHATARARDELASELGRDASDIVRLVPELGEHVGVRPEPGAERVGEQPRFRLFEAVASFLRRAAQTGPLLVTLEDLHWADLGTVMLLRFCRRELRDAAVLIVGTLRDLEVERKTDLGRALEGLQHDAHMLPLGGLDEQEVRDLLCAAIGLERAERLAPDVHRRSGGNPLFVQELGRLFGAGLGAATAVPDTVRAVLERRLSRLPYEAVELLSVAAVCAEEFRIDVLEAAAGYPRARLLELLDDGLRARVLKPVDETPPRLSFTHALVREVLYDRLTLADRAHAHRRVGAAIEHMMSADPPLAELAHHFLRASLPAGDTRASDYAEAAGRQSFERLAYEDAASHFSRAIDVLDAAEGADERRARLLLMLGEARLRTGDLPAARDAFDRTAATARRRGMPELLAEAAVTFASALGGEVRLYDRAQIDLLEEALGALPPTDSPLRARALALLSIALTFTESSERRQQLAEEAVAMARRANDPVSLIYSLGAHCDAFAAPDHSESRLVLSSEMIRVAQESHDRCGELLGRRHRLVALLELADMPAVDAEIDAYHATAEAVRQPLYLWYVPMWRAMRALMKGRVDECRALTDEVSRIGERAHSENAALLAAVLRWTAFREEGRYAETKQAMTEQLRLLGGNAGDSFWIGLNVAEENPLEARAALDRLTPTGFAQIERDTVWWLVGMAGVAEACAAVQDAEAAATAYEMIFPYESRFAIDGTATTCWGSMSRFLGVLATVVGRFDDAETHFEAALKANRRAGAPALVAHTRCAYGSMLESRGEFSRAERMFRDAIEAYEQLGMNVQADRARSLLAARGRQPAPEAGNVFRREGEFWTLTYAGRTARLKDAKGVRDIAALLARPGREIHVGDLIAAAPAAPAGAGAPGVDLGAESSEPLLDERARAAYRGRLDELRDDLEEAEQFSDVARAERARAEMDVVAGELAAALGLGGRSRTVASAGERARKAVAQRVRNALRRMQTEHPSLARHLDLSLRMGSFCSYRPERPEEWLL